MKKVLLSMACLLGFTASMSAATTLSASAAADIEGRYVEAKYKEDGSLQEAAKYQPLTSLSIDGYSFSFGQESSTKPAYYCTESGPTIRVYKTGTMTMTAPAGTTMTKIEFAGSNGTANAAHTASTGTISGVTKQDMVWAGSANELTITFAANYRISKMTVYVDGDAPVDPDPVEATTVNSIKEAKALAKGTNYVLNCEPVVVYVYNAYNYVYDGADYALFYGANGLKAGDKIKAGSTGVTDNFNGLIQFKPTKVEVDGTATIPAPEVIPFDDIAATMVAANQDQYVTFKNVRINKDNLQLGVVTAEGESVNINLFNRFGLKFQPGTFDITGFIAVFNSTIQLYVSEMEGEADPAEIGGTGEGTLESPYDCTRAIDLVKNGLQSSDEVYVKGKVVSLITAADKIDQYKNIDYWISDDGTAANQLEVFRGLYFNGADFTSANAVKPGDEVVVKGKLTLYNTTVEIDRGNQLVELNGQLGGVDNVDIDLNAPVEYFNLQGQRVENPANGLYIRRQGGKAVKVVL